MQEALKDEYIVEYLIRNITNGCAMTNNMCQNSKSKTLTEYTNLMVLMVGKENWSESHFCEGKMLKTLILSGR